MRKNQALSLLSALAVVGIAATATSALAARPRPIPDPPSCPDVYAPVLCADGNVYPNGCYASIAGQTSCVPFDDNPTS